MKNGLPPACIFQISLMINSESTWPGLLVVWCQLHILFIIFPCIAYIATTSCMSISISIVFHDNQDIVYITCLFLHACYSCILTALQPDRIIRIILADHLGHFCLGQSGFHPGILICLTRIKII